MNEIYILYRDRADKNMKEGEELSIAIGWAPDYPSALVEMIRISEVTPQEIEDYELQRIDALDDLAWMLEGITHETFSSMVYATIPGKPKGGN